jgi:hypothetical protein
MTERTEPGAGRVGREALFAEKWRWFLKDGEKWHAAFLAEFAALLTPPPAPGEYARGFNAAIKAAAGAVEGRRCRDSDALPVTVKAANHALRLAAEAIRALTRPDAAPTAATPEDQR